MIKICFVCTGNTCRSVMAERLAKKEIKLQKIQSIKFTSKGIKATGENISQNAKLVLKEKKALSSNRKSIALKKIDKDTLYVTMTESQKLYLTNNLKAQKVISFSSLIGHDVLDPYGFDLPEYRLAAGDIEQGIKILLTKILNCQKK